MLSFESLKNYKKADEYSEEFIKGISKEKPLDLMEAVKFLRDLIEVNGMAPSDADDSWDKWNQVLSLISGPLTVTPDQEDPEHLTYQKLSFLPTTCAVLAGGFLLVLTNETLPDIMWYVHDREADT